MTDQSQEIEHNLQRLEQGAVSPTAEGRGHVWRKYLAGFCFVWSFVLHST